VRESLYKKIGNVVAWLTKQTFIDLLSCTSLIIIIIII